MTVLDLESNITVDEVGKFFHINLTMTNQSEETQIHLFDLYEAYRTREKEQLMLYRLVAYIIGTLIILSNLTVVISSGLILKKGWYLIHIFRVINSSFSCISHFPVNNKCNILRKQ